MSKRLRYIILAIFFAFGTNIVLGQKTAIFIYPAEKFYQHKVISLSGEWEFYHKKFLSKPEEFSKAKPSLVKVPEIWNRYKTDEGKVKIYDYGTFRTKIALPSKGLYTLKLVGIFSAYKLFVNGKPIFECGKIDSSKNEKPDFKPEIINFYADTDTVELVLQVSNYHFFKGGITSPVKLGTPKGIFKYSLFWFAVDVFLIGSFFIFIIFFLTSYLNSKQKSNLYFSLFLLSQLIIIMFSDEYIFYILFPNTDVVFSTKLYFTALLARLITFVYFIKELPVKKLVKTRIFSWIALFLLIVWITGLVFWKISWFLTLFVAFSSVIIGIYLIYFLAKVTLKERLGSGYALAGLILLSIAALNDILIDFGIYQSVYLFGFATYLFIVLFSITISIKNARLFTLVESLSNKVKVLNELKNKLLSIPSYKIDEILKVFVSILKVERTLLFTFDKENNIILEYEVLYPNLTIIRHKKPIAEIDEEIFDKENLLKAVETKRKIAINYKKGAVSAYVERFKISSLRIFPLIKGERFFAVLYVESVSAPIYEIQDEIIYLGILQFINIIETAAVYWALQELNAELEAKVKEKTKEIEKQKQELKEKNELLDEQIKKLSQYQEILNKLNKEMEIQKKALEEKNEEIRIQNEELLAQKEELTKKYEIIVSNIEYAKKIQRIIIPTAENIPFKDKLYFFKPQNIVSGDFFFSLWLEETFIFALADCTGHGVPGALMSVLSSSGLYDILMKYHIEAEALPQPSVILDELKKFIIENFIQNENIKDGLDIALCFYHPQEKLLEFAGAYNPVYIFREGELIILKPDRMPVGVYFDTVEKKFKTQKFLLKDNDIIYLFSDGFADQFGGKEYTKFYVKNFKKLLMKIHTEPFEVQKEILEQVLAEWKNGYEQTDDISIAAFKV